MKKYYIEFEHIYEFKGVLNSTYGGVPTQEIVKMENLKELKRYCLELIRENIEYNKKWYKDMSKNFDTIERSISFQKNKNEDDNSIAYWFEKLGYVKDEGLVPILRIWVKPITKKNAIKFV